MRPEELALALRGNPLIICPWGELEWHGAHFPLGLDGPVAEAFRERLAEATGGILLPGTWLPMTTLPHANSISIPAETVCAVWRGLLAELARVGARTIGLVTGHYAQGHELEMYRESQKAMARREGLRVIAASPLELLSLGELLDHAGRSEAAQLLSVRPDLVRLDLFEEGGNAVIGEDPRGATREEGEKLLADGVEAWTDALARWDTQAVLDFYLRWERD